MTSFLCQVRRLNSLGNRAMAEAYAGGAGASLSLLFLEEAESIYINDLDSRIIDFWWCLINRSEIFLNLLDVTPVSMAEWQRQRTIYRSGGRASRTRRGFATFFLNRCNRSGIILNGGPIGGIEQVGEWTLDARFNKTDLRRRCRRVAEYAKRIHLSCLDGIDFILEFLTEKTFFFIDPPYFSSGEKLYLNNLDAAYHIQLSKTLRARRDQAWLLTYDDCPEIRALYERWATVRPFSLQYSARRRRKGNELLIAPRWLQLPQEQDSEAMTW